MKIINRMLLKKIHSKCEHILDASFVIEHEALKYETKTKLTTQ